MRLYFNRLKQYLEKDPLLRRVLRNSGYLFSSNTLSLGLSMIQSIFAARLLGLTAFGLVGIITSLVSNVNRLFSFRMGEFIIRFLGKELTEENKPRAAAIVKVAMLTEAITSLLAFVTLLLIAPWGAKLFAKEAAALPMIRLFGFSILANMVAESSLGVLQITNHFRTQAVINLLQSFLTAMIIFAAFLFHGDIYTVLWAYLIGKIILGISPVILAFYYLRNHLEPRWWMASFSHLPPRKEIIHYTVSTNLSGTIKMISTESEPLWVGFFLDKNAVGLYKLGLAIVNPMLMPITPFLSTTFPEMTKAVVTKRWKELKQLLRRVSYIAAGWIGMVAMGMLLLGEWLIRLIYGSEFVPAYPTALVLLTGFGLAGIFFWNRSLLLSFGKANIPLVVLSITALIKIGLSFWLVPKYGIMAEAILLSVNLILSVGILVFIGLLMIRRNEKQNLRLDNV